MEQEPLTNIQLCSILDSGKTANPFDEIGALFSLICPGSDLSFFRSVHTDITENYLKKHPEFNESPAKYHDLRHTYNVVLATIRLFHGLHHEGIYVAEDLICQGLLSAYFHDLGMLPQETDIHPPFPNFSRDHELRSISALRDYLKGKSLPGHYYENCSTIIKYTNLAWEPDKEVSLCGQVVGSADILAQMADRYYLESLPLLFHEHQDGGIEMHSSAIDLMSSTLDFHENVVKKRLVHTLDNRALAMSTHFKVRWGIDQNLYLESINLNLEYLRTIVRSCSMDLSCWGKFLRRNPPT